MFRMLSLLVLLITFTTAFALPLPKLFYVEADTPFYMAGDALVKFQDMDIWMGDSFVEVYCSEGTACTEKIAMVFYVKLGEQVFFYHHKFPDKESIPLGGYVLEVLDAIPGPDGTISSNCGFVVLVIRQQPS